MNFGTVARDEVEGQPIRTAIVGDDEIPGQFLEPWPIAARASGENFESGIPFWLEP